MIIPRRNGALKESEGGRLITVYDLLDWLTDVLSEPTNESWIHLQELYAELKEVIKDDNGKEV